MRTLRHQPRYSLQLQEQQREVPLQPHVALHILPLQEQPQRSAVVVRFAFPHDLRFARAHQPQLRWKSRTARYSLCGSACSRRKLIRADHQLEFAEGNKAIRRPHSLEHQRTVPGQLVPQTGWRKDCQDRHACQGSQDGLRNSRAGATFSLLRRQVGEHRRRRINVPFP